MIKPQFKISIPDDVQKKLHELGGRYSLSGNAILAAAACELARVQPENLFHALGRIAAGEAQELAPTNRDPLPPSRRPRHAKAIQDAVQV